MQQDLQAFLECRPTAAELEQLGTWRGGATMVAAREALRRATRTLVRVRRTWKLAGALAWFLVGMALSMGGIKGWWSWRERQPPPATVQPTHSPAARPPALPDAHLYSEPAASILTAYRDSADPALDDFDWYKAEILFEHAVALGDTSTDAQARLALAQGYATLERLGEGSYPAVAAAQLSAAARADFAKAAAILPNDPAPHLAMARLYVYTLPDVEKAMAEFAAAARLGAAAGRREIEQQGDAYRLRALREATRHPQQARRDAENAGRLYDRIRGFDRVEAHRAELARIRYGPARRGAKASRRYRWR